MSFIVTDAANLLRSDLKQRLERRFLFALSRFDSRILRTEVAVKHGNPEAGEQAFKCSVIVEITRASRVSLNETCAELEPCIDRAARRTSRAVGRSIGNAKSNAGSRLPSNSSSPST